MNIYTTKEIERIIDANVRHDGLSLETLVDRAGKGIAAEIAGRFGVSTPVFVFAGPYINGAYALAAARHLLSKGYSLKVLLFNIEIDPAQELCKNERDKLLRGGLPADCYTEVTQRLKLPQIDENWVVIDGIFGSELNRSLESGYVMVVRHINERSLRVVSIDVPTGMTGDWNTRTTPNNVMKATLTLAVQFPHLAFFLPNMAENIGEWKLIDVGLRHHTFRDSQAKYILIGKSETRRFLPLRKPFSSKDDFGSAIIMAGSYGMLGAAVMAAKGALRAGVGKLTVSTPICGFETIQSSVPEALYQFAEGREHFTRMRPPRAYDAVAVGPGIGTNTDTINALEDYLTTMPSPIILDADALNCIAIRPVLLNKIPNMSIITPHHREFDRLFGEQPNGDARILKALEVADTYNIVIVLKGHYTAVVRPGGMLTFNGSGTPAMATPGSGDVLTGVITAIYAQVKNPVIAAVAGVFIHGLAGEIAERAEGQYGVLATDIAGSVGKAINEILQ